jgi:small GTP-binding protein
MSDEEVDPCPEVKVVLLGESGVGKSSIIKQYVTHTFDPDIDSSISSKYISKETEVDDIKKKIKFNLWDTAGQEKYRSLAKIFYKDARIIILVYSINNLKSFESLKQYWYQEVKTNGLSNVIYAIVGNKNDLYNTSQVDEKEAMAWADSIGGIFQLTSAKSNSGIDTLFINLAKKFFDPEFDYKKEDEEAKKIYEMKKKETEESKRKKKKEEEITMKLPKIETIKLHEQNNVNETKKKGGCC